MDERLARRLLTAERNRVTAKLRELQERLAMEEREAAGQLADYDQHQADAATEQYERERDEGRLEEVREELAAIERAERRLEEGTYGVSVVSGAPIPDERLRLIPYAERTAEEEAEWRRLQAAPMPRGDADDEDVRTPLDGEEPPPPDLGMIPLAVDPRDRIDDPQELSDEVDLEMPGEVYPTENAVPGVGEPERSDPEVERRYRPGDVRASGTRRRREAMQLLIDAGHLEVVPRGSPGAAAALLRRARRHLTTAEASGERDLDGVVALAWLASRHALGALLVADGMRLRDNSAVTVGAYAELALPGEAGLAAAELEEAETLMAHEGLETVADDARDNLRRAKRVVGAVSDQLIVDERVAETM
jgi:DnaK suppressor protein